ncbi:MAG TPA: hypothetical protein VFI31_01670, partial [Pirellulales bacterium]|nr:hypothetical protein [Pirellulales bacterium]
LLWHERRFAALADVFGVASRSSNAGIALFYQLATKRQTPPFSIVRLPLKSFTPRPDSYSVAARNELARWAQWEQLSERVAGDNDVGLSHGCAT